MEILCHTEVAQKDGFPLFLQKDSIRVSGRFPTWFPKVDSNHMDLVLQGTRFGVTRNQNGNSQPPPHGRHNCIWCKCRVLFLPSRWCHKQGWAIEPPVQTCLSTLCFKNPWFKHVFKQHCVHPPPFSFHAKFAQAPGCLNKHFCSSAGRVERECLLLQPLVLPREAVHVDALGGALEVLETCVLTQLWGC